MMDAAILLEQKRLRCIQLAGYWCQNGPEEFRILIDEEAKFALERNVHTGLAKLEELCKLAEHYQQSMSAYRSYLGRAIDEDLWYLYRAAELLAADPDLKEIFGYGYGGLVRLSKFIIL